MPEEVFGLDIGTSTLKLVGLRPERDTFELMSHAIVTNPVGQILPESVADKTRLIVSIQQLLQSARAQGKKVRVGLPESLVFTKVIQIPLLTDTELASAIRWEAEQHIPIPLAEIYLDYTVLSRPERGDREGMMDILLVAAKRTTIHRVVDLLESSKLELEMVDTGLLGVVRALSRPKDPPTLFMHSGASASDVAVVADKKILLTHTLPIAGTSLTRAAELELSLSASQAEQYKRAYGLQAHALEGKVRHALMGAFQSILAGLKKAMNSYDSTKPGKSVQRVILSGGTALMPGISSEVASALGVSEVILGNPFMEFSMQKGVSLPAEQTVYTVAAGLAKGAKV